MLSKVFSVLSAVALLFSKFADSHCEKHGRICYLYPESLRHHGQPVDDTPGTLEAFERCGNGGRIIFSPHTFHINQVMNTTGLRNCEIELQDAELLFSNDISYWLNHSIPVTLQDQHTAWLVGGDNVSLMATPDSKINGQGQFWYDENKNRANQLGRPITMTFINSTNLFVDGLNIIQPQFWALFVSYTKNATFNNIYVNATSISNWSTVNTDGIDIWNSHGIYLNNWTVDNGDDCIAAKGNTSDLYVRNATCYHGYGITIGSVGQYPLTPDYNEDTLFEDISIIDCHEGAYIKTWQGASANESSNGDAGGGGYGYVRNITFRNFYVENVALPIQISQCIYTEAGSDCEDSKMQTSDITWENFTGTSQYNIAASLHCAASHPCPGIYFKDVNITSVNSTLGLPLWNTTLQDEVYQCANIVNENTTSGIPCNRYAPANFGQSVTGNVQ